MVKRIYSNVMGNSLYRNSIYLLASTMITAVFGFIFWIVTARLVAPEQIGIATVIISASTLITQFSLLGLKNGIIRFLPQSQTKNNKINTGTNAIIIFTLILCLGFIALIPLLSPKLLFLRNNWIYSLLFTVFVISFSLNQLQEGIFVAYRSTGFVLWKNTLWAVIKSVLPFLTFILGAYGIFLAFSLGSVVSFIFGLLILVIRFQYRYLPRLDAEVIKKMGRFCFGNYVGGFLASVPGFVLPLIILNFLGSRTAAFYYIDLQVATTLYIIPVATTQSLFAEGSNDETALKMHLKKTLLLTALLIIPAVLITVFFGGFILSIFGKVYAGQGLLFLQLMAVSGIFFSINSIGSAVLNIQKKVGLYIILNVISVAIVTIGSFILIPFQLIGIGIAWLMALGTLSLLYLFLLRRILW